MSHIAPKFFPALAVAVSFLLPHPSFAEIKVATVDVAKILNDSEEAQSKKKELDAISQKAKKDAEAKRVALQDMEKKLKDAQAAEDSKEAEAFRNQAKLYTRFVKDTEEDLKKRFVRVNREITEKVMRKISEFAKAKDIDLILDKSDRARGPVLFGDSSVDVTEDIIDSL